MVGQPHRNFMKMASWSSVSEHLVNPIGMSDQLKWNNHFKYVTKINNQSVTLMNSQTFNVSRKSKDIIEKYHAYRRFMQ